MTKGIKNSLKELGFNKNEVKIYIALTQLGEATASQAAKKADLPRTTAISILNNLKNKNYLTAHRYRGATFYWIESPKAIVNVFKNKIDIAESLNSQLTNVYRSEAHFPFVQVYDTKTGIRQFMEKTITSLNKKSAIYTIDAPTEGNYSKIFSDNIREIIFGQKTKRGVVTHTLVPGGSFKNIDKEKINKRNIIIREMPKEISFKASLWIIDNLIVHFSGNPPFATVIKHEKIITGIKSIYDFLWSISEPKN